MDQSKRNGYRGMLNKNTIEVFFTKNTADHYTDTHKRHHENVSSAYQNTKMRMLSDGLGEYCKEVIADLDRMIPVNSSDYVSLQKESYDCSFSTDDFDTRENVASGVSNRSAVLTAHRHTASNGIFDYEIRSGGTVQQFERRRLFPESQASLVMK